MTWLSPAAMLQSRIAVIAAQRLPTVFEIPLFSSLCQVDTFDAGKQQVVVSIIACLLLPSNQCLEVPKQQLLVTTMAVKYNHTAILMLPALLCCIYCRAEVPRCVQNPAFSFRFTMSMPWRQVSSSYTGIIAINCMGAASLTCYSLPDPCLCRSEVPCCL